ncbi:MAG: hypothetical protein GF329_05550 [Candidatus Lokiarchaeota archaeon]|nr:hypothetical protein [Candidatus Lokiarchaeota archaeon]
MEISNDGDKGDRRFWIDAIDLSWMWGYYENRNYHETGGLSQGHYPSIERFNLLILEINGDVAPPFEQGINVILIPVSLFLHSNLHAMMENQETVKSLSDESSSGIAAEFYGMDRSKESISEHVEGIISKDQVTASEAWDILELLLQNATGYVIHDYTKCDTTGSVEKLGLASDILEMVAFDGKSMENGPTGKLPSETLVGAFLVVTGLIIFFAIAIATMYFFINLGRMLANWGMEFLTSFAEGAKAALEAAIKIIILVLAYLILALNLLIMTIGFILMSLILIEIANIANLKYQQDGIFIITLSNSSNDLIFRMKYEIYWEYIPYFNLELPSSRFIVEKNGILFYESKDSLFSISSCEVSNSNTLLKKSEGNISNTSIDDKIKDVSSEFWDYFALGSLTAEIIILVFLVGFLTLMLYNPDYLIAIPIAAGSLLLIFSIIYIIALISEKDPKTQYNDGAFLLGFGKVLVERGVNILKAGSLSYIKQLLEGFGKEMLQNFLWFDVIIVVLPYIATYNLYPIIAISLGITNLLLIGFIGILLGFTTNEKARKSFKILGYIFIIVGFVLVICSFIIMSIAINRANQ